MSKAPIALASSGTSVGHIRWIKVSDRVPEDRRQVLAWGPCDWFLGAWERKPVFLGVTRFNPSGKDGERGRFDVENRSPMSMIIWGKGS